MSTIKVSNIPIGNVDRCVVIFVSGDLAAIVSADRFLLTSQICDEYAKWTGFDRQSISCRVMDHNCLRIELVSSEMDVVIEPKLSDGFRWLEIGEVVQDGDRYHHERGSEQFIISLEPGRIVGDDDRYHYSRCCEPQNDYEKRWSQY